MAGDKRPEASSRKDAKSAKERMKYGEQQKRMCFLAISALPVHVRAQAGLERALVSGREARLVFL
jgi:hypothetical protein